MTSEPLPAICPVMDGTELLRTWEIPTSALQPHMLYTGSDDCAFKAWDLREDPDAGPCAESETNSGLTFHVASEPACLHTNRKTHSAGVCTISPHPVHAHILATGSYDERVRLWDLRNPARPLLTSEVRACATLPQRRRLKLVREPFSLHTMQKVACDVDQLPTDCHMRAARLYCRPPRAEETGG